MLTIWCQYLVTSLSSMQLTAKQCDEYALVWWILRMNLLCRNTVVLHRNLFVVCFLKIWAPVICLCAAFIGVKLTSLSPPFTTRFTTSTSENYYKQTPTPHLFRNAMHQSQFFIIIYMVPNSSAAVCKRHYKEKLYSDRNTVCCGSKIHTISCGNVCCVSILIIT